jgi:hypothetical protein
MGSRSKRPSERATSRGRQPGPRPRKQEVLNFTAAFWDAVHERAAVARKPLARKLGVVEITRNRRRRGAPSPYRVKVAEAIAAAFSPFAPAASS